MFARERKKRKLENCRKSTEKRQHRKNVIERTIDEDEEDYKSHSSMNERMRNGSYFFFTLLFDGFSYIM